MKSISDSNAYTDQIVWNIILFFKQIITLFYFIIFYKSILVVQKKGWNPILDELEVLHENVYWWR